MLWCRISQNIIGTAMSTTQEYFTNFSYKSKLGSLKLASYYCSMLVFFFRLSTVTITYSKYTTVDDVTKGLGWRHSSKVICRLATDSSLLSKWSLNQFAPKSLHRLTSVIILKEESDTHRSESESLFMFSSNNTLELPFLSKKTKLHIQNASRYTK